MGFDVVVDSTDLVHVGTKEINCIILHGVVYFSHGAIVLQGGQTFHFSRMGVMPMKNHFDFKDLLTFGIFLLALLTFVFTFCK